MINQIFLITLYIFLNVSFAQCANTSKSAKEETSKKNDADKLLIEAVKSGNKQKIKQLLGSNKFSLGTLESAIKVLPRENKHELLQIILHYSPARKELEEHLKTYFPNEITTIIEEYSRPEDPLKIQILQGIENVISNAVLLVNNIRSMNLDEEEINLDKEFFKKLKELNTGDIIQLLNILKKELVFNNLILSKQHLELTEKNAKAAKSREDLWLGIIAKLKQSSPPQVKEILQVFNTLPRIQPEDVQSEGLNVNFLYYFYEYLYYLLDEEDIKKNGIERPEELKEKLPNLKR